MKIIKEGNLTKIILIKKESELAEPFFNKLKIKSKQLIEKFKIVNPAWMIKNK